MTLNRIKTQLFINNQFVDSKSKQTFNTINPATEQIIASVQRASVHDVDIAVQAARDAFVKWRDVSGKDRRDLLLKFADLMEENKEYLAGVESADNGKPISKAREGDIPTAIHTLRYFAGWADKLSGKTIPVEDTATFSMTVHEPIGVVGGIIPWNYPILLFIWKLAPLIACGCTCVIKSSEKTPLSALLLAQLVQEAGFPPGVINVLSGFGPDCGRALARHAHVDKIVFTGSTATGHKIVQYSAESNLKKVTLELGGKSPLIVCDDADLEAAADAARDGLFGNSGQVCCASSRIFVDSKVYDRFVQMCVDRAKKITMGTEEGKFQGPQVDEIQFKKILAYIECGKQQGAKCILGGKRYGTTGYYIEPTIFSDVQDEMKIAKEEIFGPVMQLMKFDSIEGVIARSNDTNFGLAAGVFSKDIAKAMGIASRLQAGTVWINEWGNSDVSVPFGGYKQSGWGRDKGQYALENYMEVKMISFPINKYK